MSGYRELFEGGGHHRGDVLADLFYPVYNRIFDANGQFVTDLDKKLAASRTSDPVELYLSKALAYGVIAGGSFWLVGMVVGGLLISTGIIEFGLSAENLRLFLMDIGWSIPLDVPWGAIESVTAVAAVPLFLLTSGVILGSLGFILVFGALVALPYSRAGRRRREINMVMPDAVSYMFALSVGGMSQLEIIEAVAEAEDTYGEVSREFRSILQETRYFDTDYRSAIRNCATRTPSAELSMFLTDMLSIIDSGGNMTEFLNDKKDLHFRTAKDQQQQNLDMLELFSEMYITLSLFPLLLIIILVVMSLMGGTHDLLLLVTVYGLIPILGTTFLVLVATIKQDEVGDGYIRAGEEGRRFDAGGESGPFDLGYIGRFTGTYHVFDRIRNREGSFRIKQFLTQPHVFFRNHPYYTLVFSVPAALLIVGAAVFAGMVPWTWTGVLEHPIWSTFIYIYLPLFVVGAPFAVFWELNLRSRRAVLNDLSENLRKLASANATGLTLLESVKVVADSTPGKLGEEFDVMYTKSTYGMHLNESLVVFNNKYHVPRLARTVKLISKAHEISGEISAVLTTAARASEAQEDIERERVSHARIQLAIIILTFLTLLGVMAVMKVQFVDVMGDVTGGVDGAQGVADGFGGTIDPQLLGLLFFHAVTIQAIISGFVCGYIRRASLAAGAKYVVALSAVTLLVWVIAT